MLANNFKKRLGQIPKNMDASAADSRYRNNADCRIKQGHAA